MQPENIPQALPLAVAIYGHDVRVVSDPALLGRGLVVIDRKSSGARFGAQRTPRSGELVGSGVLHYGDLSIDVNSRVVLFGSIAVKLRRREYDLLVYLARDPERVWTRHDLLRDVWGYRLPAATRTVESHASRVRRALAAAGAVGWVVSVWGVGYRLAPGGRDA